jgi:hypothetical protein
MRAVICAWSSGNAEQFEAAVPLNFVGRRNLDLGFSNDIHVLFLDGHDRLAPAYLHGLERLGFRVSNCQDSYRSVSAEFESLDQLGDYEKKCFLRWLVIEQFFNGDAFLHFDGDIVFNADPATLCERLSSRTFVLQGCPAVAAISDRAWLARYGHELRLFARDIKGYSERAWNVRPGHEESWAKKWAGSRHRPLISSDQDLMSHLIHTDGLPQDSPQVVVDSLGGYIMLENPLWIQSHIRSFVEDLPLEYERVDGVDFLNGQRIALWHMQAEFCRYLSSYLKQKRFLGLFNKRLPYPGHTFELTGPRAYIALQKMSARMLEQRARVNLSRLEIYRHFFGSGDFSGLFRNQRWWKDGVFTDGVWSL